MRFIGLIGVRIGLGDGENQIENEMTLVAVAVVGNGDGRIVAENRHSVGEFVPIDVVETGANKGDGFLDGIGGDGDADGLDHRDGIGDGGEDGGFHRGQNAAGSGRSQNIF